VTARREKNCGFGTAYIVQVIVVELP